MNKEELKKLLVDGLDTKMRSIDHYLSARSRNCLRNAAIFTIRDLITVRSNGHILLIHNFGKKSLQEVDRFLEEVKNAVLIETVVNITVKLTMKHEFVDHPIFVVDEMDYGFSSNIADIIDTEITNITVANTTH